jgi:hypothetical protein
MKNDKRINDFEQHEPTMNPDVNSCTSERNEVLAPLMAPVKVVTRLSYLYMYINGSTEPKSKAKYYMVDNVNA